MNASHRSRLRVEIGRLRKATSGVAEPVATAVGYTLATERDVVILVTGREDDATADEDARIALLLGAEHRAAGVALRATTIDCAFEDAVQINIYRAALRASRIVVANLARPSGGNVEG